MRPNGVGWDWRHRFYELKKHYLLELVRLGYGVLQADTDTVWAFDPFPMLIAMASDDPLFNHEGFGLVTSWHDAGGATELHWYTRGGHGFGAIEQGTTSDRWLNQFLAWLNTL